MSVALLLAILVSAVSQTNPVTPVCDRTPKVRDEIVRLVPRVNDCADVTEVHLAEIDGVLNLRGPQDIFSINVNHREGHPDIISELKTGDFSGLPALRGIDLSLNNLTTLPKGVFSGLPALQQLSLQYNRLRTFPEKVFSGLSSLRGLSLDTNSVSSLPDGVFSELVSLQVLSLGHNSLARLPEKVFFGLSALQRIDLSWNRLTSLPVGVFSGLGSLQRLILQQNQLTSLPEEVFSELSSLEGLSLENNEFGQLPEGIFSSLTSLKGLYLNWTGLNSLPEGIFAGLPSLEWLRLTHNQLSGLPEKIFSGLSSLKILNLGGNQLASLPPGVFSGLTSLQELVLGGNVLRKRSLPDGIFSELSELKGLYLNHNRLRSLPDGLFSGLVSLEGLFLNGNPVDPFLIPVSLEWVEAGRFRARVRTGAPIEIDLSIILPRGVTVEGGSRRIKIPRGNVESAALSVSRSPDTTAAVTVDFLQLSTPPIGHDGYTLVRSPMPLTVWEAQSLEFPHFANGSSTTSELVMINVGTEPIRPLIYFYDKRGNAVDAESVVQTAGELVVQGDGALTPRTAVEPLGELTVSTHGRGELVTGSARVVADGPIGGVLRFNAPGIGVTGVRSGRLLRDAIFPVRRQSRGINTGAAIRNPGEDPIAVRCQLMKHGNVQEEVEVPLETKGQEARFIDEWFAQTDTSDFTGSLRCRAFSRGTFTGLALEMDSKHGIFTTLPALPIPSRTGFGPSTLFHFPHFANGSSITSDLVFINVYHSPIRPTIHFYDTNGKIIAADSVVEVGENMELREDGGLTIQGEVAPLSELTISTHGRGELVTGSVRMVADGRIAGVLRYDSPTVGVAGVGIGDPVWDAIFPARRQVGGINTGVAIRNLDDEPITVSCRLMKNGQELEEREILLPSDGQAARFIDELFVKTDTANFVGSVRCVAPDNKKFTGVALEMDAGNRIFTTLPMVPVLR